MNIAVDRTIFPAFDQSKEKRAFGLLSHLDHKIETAIKQSEVDQLYHLLKRREGIVDYIVSHNLELVLNIANEYQISGQKLGKLMCEANNGLILSVDDFSNNLMLRFKAYAGRKIRRSIIRFFLNNSRTKINSGIIDMALTIEDINNEVMKKEGILPTIKELKSRMKIKDLKNSPDELKSLRMEKSMLIHSLINPMMEEQTLSFAEEPKSIINESLVDLNHNIFHIALDVLGLMSTKRLSYEEISRKYHTSENEIKRIEKQILKSIENKIDKNLILG